MKRFLAFFLSVLSFGCAHALGIIDFASVTQYSGWGCDTSLPGQQVAIHAWRDDGKFIGATIASNPREQGVGTACASPHSAQGFVLTVTPDPSLMDNKWHNVNFYTVGANNTVAPLNNSPARVFFEGTPENVDPPSAIGDVVGRDLNIQGAGFVGHIGIWDGNSVIEMLKAGGSNEVFKNSWETFKNITKTWNTAHPQYSDIHSIKSCWSTSCDGSPNHPSYVNLIARQAVVNRAFQVYLIGAGYTYTADPVIAVPAMTEAGTSWQRPAVRGLYRCDTFVVDAFYATTTINNNVYHPIRTTSNSPSGWSSKVGNFMSGQIPTPEVIMAKIRAL
jgi:hypothetical protein